MIIRRNMDKVAAVRASQLEVIKAAAIARVNEGIAAQRAQYITIIPGQEMIYLAKESEARDWMAGVNRDYPLLEAEVGITAPTIEQLVQIWLNMADLWRSVAATLEGARLSMIALIQNCTTQEEIENLILG